ncbi:MAG TPA: lamin tail domain-containing protein, partial [Bacteroidetes bacterium]|nr:lamin tail domain-containing protein [Bacteroidota bacterium]
MNKPWIVLFLIFISVNISSSQVYDDFSDGDFRTDPGWKGDLADFIINDQYQLQLDAAEAGSSNIYLKYKQPDSIQWDFYFKMDFSPSNSNKLRVYLTLDNIDLDIASGYFLEIGENGGDDKLKLYRLDHGNKIILAEGKPGQFANQPAESFIRVQRSDDKFWSIFTKNNDNPYYKIEFEVYSDEPIPDSSYFMLSCLYTSTRKNKFFFDDIAIDIFEDDKYPPEIIKSEVVSKNKLKVIFDEPVYKEIAINSANYHLKSSNINPDSVSYRFSVPNEVILSFPFDFESGIYYTLVVSGIEDTNRNKMTETRETTFFLIDKPGKGDIVINEILFNPNTGGNDFLELINISGKILNLNGLIISNNMKENKNKVLDEDIILENGHYICITKDTSKLINDYFIPDTAFLYENDLPSFDDDRGNISLTYFNSTTGSYATIDSFDYSEDMHSGFLNDVEGISLERKNPFIATIDSFNWASAATITGGATPGYKNSS